MSNIQHPIIKLGRVGNFLKLIKTKPNKPYNEYHSGERLHCCTLNQEKGPCSPSPLLFNMF